MFDFQKRRNRFLELIKKVKLKHGLVGNYQSHDLRSTFLELLLDLRDRDLDLETCVELVDLVLFDKKNGQKTTISRLQEQYEGYSDYMLGSYVKLGLDPNDNLMQELVEIDLEHGISVDQLVTSGWFYYQKWPLIHGLEVVVFKSRKVNDIMFKAALKLVMFLF